MAFGVHEQAEVPRAETMPAFMMPSPSAPIPKMPPRPPAFVCTPPTTYAQANLHFGQTAPNAGFQNPMSHGGPYDGNPSEHGVGRSIHRDVTYAIPVKAPECYKFDGNIVNFLPWKIRMLNHMATATQRYRSLIDRCIKSTTPITMANLKSTAVDKFNAWEIATEVEASPFGSLVTSCMRTDLCLAATKNSMVSNSGATWASNTRAKVSRQ